MKTLLLDVQAWDLVVDASGNIALASNPYAIAQDAASAIRLLQGELWYDTKQGVPYFQQIFGQPPNISLIKAKLAAAAESVPEVASASVFLSAITNRNINGQVHITTTSGQTAVAAF